MAEKNTEKGDEKPVKIKLPDAKKGILKSPGHYDDPAHRPEEGIKWDEMNILQTFHPAGKDYGHMKIDEPDTPYNKYADPDGEDDADPMSDSEADRQMDPNLLSKKLECDTVQKRWWEKEAGEESSSEEESEAMTDEAKEKQAEFKKKRNQHYNEAENIRLAKQLIEQELAELEDGEEANTSSANNDSVKETDPAAKAAGKATEENMQH